MTRKVAKTVISKVALGKKGVLWITRNKKKVKTGG